MSTAVVPEIDANQADVEAYLEDIHKVYMMGHQQVHALGGVSAVFHKGDFWAILGSSGSGKSTLLNLIGCLDRPTAGRYVLGGQDGSTRDDNQLSDIRLRHLGFIFQSFNLLQQATVEENIQLPLYYQGWESRRGMERARELADQVGLGSRLTHRPTELSGGQMQRVAIARALANDPDIILADEPTGNLDSKTGLEIMNLLQRLNQEGKTIIMVTHERDIAAFTRKHMFMEDGRIQRIEELGRDV